MSVQRSFTMRALGCVLFMCVLASGAWAQDAAEPQVDTGDTAWILVSSAFVLCMTLPGLALFYGGLVRSKNVLGTIMHTAIILCMISIVWILWGYSLAFAPDIGGIIGGLQWFGLHGVGLTPSPDYASTVPHQLFMVFQLMFAAITVALITGSFAERMKFKALLWFAVLWSTFIYSPLAHWVWGGGMVRTARSPRLCRWGGRAHQFWICRFGLCCDAGKTQRIWRGTDAAA